MSKNTYQLFKNFFILLKFESIFLKSFHNRFNICLQPRFNHFSISLYAQNLLEYILKYIKILTFIVNHCIQLIDLCLLFIICFFQFLYHSFLSVNFVDHRLIQIKIQFPHFCCYIKPKNIETAEILCNIMVLKLLSSCS